MERLHRLWTAEERAGKFVADGVFDPNKVDPQLGVAVILKELMGLDNSIIFGVAPSAPSGSPRARCFSSRRCPSCSAVAQQT